MQFYNPSDIYTHHLPFKKIIGKQIEIDCEDDNGKKKWHIIWKNRPIKYSSYRDIQMLAKKSSDYTCIDSKKKASMKLLLKEINDKNKSSFTLDQFISIYESSLKQKTIDNKRFLKNIKFMASQSYIIDKLDIIKISNLYDFPPSFLLKEIFIIKGYDKNKVEILFGTPINTDSEIDELFKKNIGIDSIDKKYDFKQYKITQKKDFDSNYHRTLIAEIALENEKILVDYFINIGIQCKTQDDLTKEQTIQYGRPMFTPDILFIDPVFINGVEIKWLDFKNYTCTNNKFLYDSNLKQIAKYTEEFGMGAMCYNYSIVQNIRFFDVVILDATAIGLDFKK